MSKISQTKAGVALSYVMLVITNALHLILIPIIISYVGSDNYGIYISIGSLAASMVILDFGMGSTIARYVAKYRSEGKIKEEENFLASALILYGAISVFVIIIGIISSLFIDNIFAKTYTADDIVLARTMFLILVANVAVSLPMNCFSAVMNGYEKFVFPRFLSIIRVIIRFVIIIILLRLGNNVMMIVIVDTVLNILMQVSIMLYVIFGMKIKMKLHKWDKAFIKEIFAFSGLIFMTMVYDQIFWKVDQTIIGAIISKTAAAVCALGVQINVFYMRFSTALSEVFLPRVTQMVTKGAKGPALTDFMIKIGRIQMLVLSLVMSGVIIFGQTFFRLWMKKFTEVEADTAWKICLIVMIPLTIPLIQNMGISILRAMNKHAFRSKVYLAIAIINIFVTILLIKYIGILGAPIATAIALTIGNIIIINIYYHKAIGIEVMRFFKETILAFLPIILISLGLGYLVYEFLLVESIGSMLLWISVFSLMYLALAYLFVMNEYEKNLGKRVLSKIKSFVGK